ncbi:MAG: hypothetical protein ACR2PL_11110 [Dehalococcoidia bacterium]
MAFGLLHGFLVERVYEFLPRWIARRIVPTDVLAQEVRIGLRPNIPVEVQFGTTVPYLGICLRLTNLSLANVKLDRLVYDVWFGQPTVKASHVEPCKIAWRSSEDILLRENLNADQRQQIQSQAKGEVIELVTINMTAYFESKGGPFEVRERIEHRDIVCRGIAVKPEGQT